MKPRIIKFTIEKGIRAPKEINKEKTVFSVFIPEKTIIKPGETKFVYTKFSVSTPEDILTTFIITPDLKTNGLKLTGQLNEEGQRIRLEYFNKTLKTFILRRNLPIAIFMTLNEGNKSFKKKIVKI